MTTSTMLTTIDNPYDPFTEWDSWYAYDTRMGHGTASLLARVTVTSSELSEADQALAIDHAIDEIIKENVSGIHTSVTKDVEE